MLVFAVVVVDGPFVGEVDEHGGQQEHNFKAIDGHFDLDQAVEVFLVEQPHLHLLFALRFGLNLRQLLIHPNLIVAGVVFVVQVHCLYALRFVIHVNSYLFRLHGYQLRGLDCDFEVFSGVDDHGRLEEA